MTLGELVFLTAGLFPCDNNVLNMSATYCINRDTAGKNFQKYAITHAGLGVWDITSDEKFTIEFVSVDYVGSLLPNFDEVNKKLIWNNTGMS